MIETSTTIFDINTLISAAILKNSIPSKALDFAVRYHQLIHSIQTLLELQEVLYRTKFDKYITSENRIAFFNYIKSNSLEVKATSIINDCRDSNDNKFLELAVDGNADFIITGDKDLLVLHPYQNISILTPSAFLEVVK